VVVCVYSERSEVSGVVSTTNYTARRYSAKSDIPIHHAKKKLENVPETIFLPVNEPYYAQVSNSIMKTLKKECEKAF